MRLVVFGLTVSSSWGNGHATIWRGLCGALARQGHRIEFFERDVPYYALHRDLNSSDNYDLILYSSWEEIAARARGALKDADCAVVTSYCPDARAAADLVLEAPLAQRIFYDLDTPITLGRLRAGEEVEYLPTYGLEPFDLVLSYTGGPALEELHTRLGARRPCMAALIPLCTNREIQSRVIGEICPIWVPMPAIGRINCRTFLSNLPGGVPTSVLFWVEHNTLWSSPGPITSGLCATFHRPSTPHSIVPRI